MKKTETEILRNCINSISRASTVKVIWDIAIDEAVRKEEIDEELADTLRNLTTAFCGAVAAWQAVELINIYSAENDYEDGDDEDFEDEPVPAPDVIVFDTDRHMKIINIDDCFAEVPWFGDSTVLIPVPELEGLYLTCQKEEVISARGKDYLVGQAVVMRLDENKEPLSVTLADGMNVCKIMDQRLGVLINDRNNEQKKAFCLS